MCILAIETSTRHGSVALLRDGETLAAERSWEGHDGHSLLLLPAIHQLFQEVASDPRAIACVAVAIGPGSFTGLRVGLATAKGLALGWQVPLIAVSTLAAMARNVTESVSVPNSNQVPVPHLVPMLDARQGEIYSAVFRPDGTMVAPEQVIAPARWADTLRALGVPCLCFGEGVLRYRDPFASARKVQIMDGPETVHYPRAGFVALCARDLRARGAYADLHTVVPQYLRRTYAEERHVPSA